MLTIRDALENTPPELSGDICDRGIVLTGGGAYLLNLDKRIRDEVGVPVSIAEKTPPVRRTGDRHGPGRYSITTESLDPVDRICI